MIPFRFPAASPRGAARGLHKTPGTHATRGFPPQLDRRRRDGHAGPARAPRTLRGGAAGRRPHALRRRRSGRAAPWLDELVFLDLRAWSQLQPAAALALKREPIDLASAVPELVFARAAWSPGWAAAGNDVGFVRYGRGPLLTYRMALVRDRHGQLIPTRPSTPTTASPKPPGARAPSYRMELFTTSARRGRWPTPSGNVPVWAITRRSFVSTPARRVRVGEALAGRPFRAGGRVTWPRADAAAACWCAVRTRRARGARGIVEALQSAPLYPFAGRPSAVARANQGVHPPLRSRW